MKSAKSSTEYLYFVLVPVAELFRAELPQRKRSFMAIKNAKTCRVKFGDKQIEKNWQNFCESHGLKNDTGLEY
ncbi:hypothetical protein SMC37_000585 [Cronobacter sakazakii]|nr:hypothetical protein [Cronobacter sakazakii]EKK4042862.1 hypothetical protein [Cronobacter sakazakii]ELY2731373.1 hypothetical protein [Cronobacter sakazakii]MBK4113795.1 hypothetical protein [Cronobacter sakazakii]MDT3518966.1 hypothetical protein [Cronobacter sakazakii]MDT3546529.1 hypothetical protein [Cronobacter sakazakii]